MVDTNIGEGMVYCSCGTEGIHVDHGEEIYISIWRYGQAYSRGWKWRLKHIWRILRVGHPYGDNVCLDENSTQTLIQLLENARQTVPWR